jgi:proteasome assembly chaperone (PAC2) family protein
MFSQKYLDIDPSSLKFPVALIGLPGIGNVGRIAIESLVQLLDAQSYMDFYSDDFPATIFVREGVSAFPKSTFYLSRSAPDEGHDLLLLTADFQPSTGRGVFEYADFVAQELEALGITRVLALAAYEQDYRSFFQSYPSPPRIYASASTDALLGELLKLRGATITSMGLINGANGVIPSWAATKFGMEGGCLLGETLGVIKADYRASRELLEGISTLLGLQADLGFLDDHVAKVVEFIEWAKDEIATKGASEASEEDPFDRYIG